MTDLLTRVTERARPGRPDPRQLPLRVVAAALAAAGTTLITLLAVALIGWFLADAGAHGDTVDALLIGAQLWLAAHGADVALGGVPVSVVPLGLVCLVAGSAVKYARWAARSWPQTSGRGQVDPREFVLAAGTFVAVYLIAVVVVGVLVTAAGGAVGLGRAILGGLLIGLLGAAGMAHAAGWLDEPLRRIPGWLRTVVRGALVCAALVLAAGALLVVTGLVLGFNEAATVYSGLRLSTSEAFSYTAISAAFAPNAALYAVAYLAGPGFAVGSGTVVSPGAVDLGPIPAFPLLAALPDSVPQPGWLLAVIAVPVLAAMVAAGWAQRAYPVPAWDSSALRGFGVGLGGAMVLAVAVFAASGSLGTGRLSTVGGSFAEVVVALVPAMSLGGLVGALAVAGWQRRGRR